MFLNCNSSIALVSIAIYHNSSIIDTSLFRNYPLCPGYNRQNVSCKRKVLPPKISTLAQKTSIYCSYPTAAHFPKVTPCTFLLNTSRCLLPILLPLSPPPLLSFLPSSILCTVTQLSILASIRPSSSLFGAILISISRISHLYSSNRRFYSESCSYLFGATSSLFGAILTPSFLFYFGDLITSI